jgi:flagellar hook-associated protein 3 FlgL
MVAASDDPVGAGLAVSLRESLAKIAQAQRNGDQAEARLQASQDQLSDVLSVLGDVKDLALRGINGASTLSNRQGLALEVNQELERLLADANASSIDGYLFGGTQTTVAPFTATRNVNGEITAVTANPLGINGQVHADIPGGQRVVMNVPGSAVFTATSPDIFSVLITVRDQLRADDVVGLEASMSDVNAAVDQVGVVLADVGSRIGRIRDARQRAYGDLLTLRDRLSKIEDADMAEVSIEFQQAQNVYQAALAAASRVGQINLVDFLR